jgi:hypothetical protein
MSKREFDSLTLVEVSRMLHHREMVRRRENDIPSARLQLLIMEMFRNSEELPEPFTFHDVLPYLNEQAPVDPAAAALLEAKLLEMKTMSLLGIASEPYKD